MNTTAAAQTAGVTVDTIRYWCRYGAIQAIKHAGRWIIDAASLAHRIALGARRTPTTPDHTTDLIDEVTDQTFEAVDHYSTAALKTLLTHVRARDTHTIAGINPHHVHLTDTQWGRLEHQVSFQISSLHAEY